MSEEPKKIPEGDKPPVVDKPPEPATDKPQEQEQVQGQEPEPQGSDVVEFTSLDGEVRNYTRQQLYSLAQLGEQQIREDTNKSQEKIKEEEVEKTDSEKIVALEARLAQQEKIRQDETYTKQTLAALDKLNEPHGFTPKAKKLIDLQTCAMLRNSNSDISVEHEKAVIVFKEALIEYNEQQKEKATANHKAKVFSELGAGQRSGGGLPQMEPDKPRTADHVTSGAALNSMTEVIRHIRES